MGVNLTSKNAVAPDRRMSVFLQDVTIIDLNVSSFGAIF